MVASEHDQERRDRTGKRGRLRRCGVGEVLAVSTGGGGGTFGTIAGIVALAVCVIIATAIIVRRRR